MGLSAELTSTGMRYFSIGKRLGFGMASLILPLLLLTFSGYFLFHMAIGIVDESYQEVELRFVPVSMLQESLLRAVMPANDYLIHGNVDERSRFKILRIEVEQGFDRVQASPFQDSRRNDSIAKARLLWNEAARLSEEILLLDKAQGNPVGSRRMEEMDALVDDAYDQLEYVCSAVVSELGSKHSMLHAISIKMGIVIAVFVVLVTVIVFVGSVLIRSWIIAPLKMLESGAKEFTEGRLEHRITVNSNDEIASVARTLNHMASELKRDRDILRSLSSHDQLTGLLNRKEFQRLLDLEIERSLRHGGELALLMIDVDRFKSVNDNYGHPVGDSVLRNIADRIFSSLRPNDVVARYGGEEFIVMLPETDAMGSVAISERLCAQMRESAIFTMQNIQLTVTVSVGIASYPADATTADEVISLADKALYAAKNAGRDRCCRYAQLPVSAENKV